MVGADSNTTVAQLKNIHREFRTALLNKKYYGCRLDRYQTINRWLEIVIAFGATSGTGIAGFAIWKNGAGVVAWGIISGASIILSTLKPIIDLPKQIERYSKLSTAYSRIFETFRVLEQELHEGGLTDAHVQAFKQIRSQLVDLAVDDDRKPNIALVKRLEDEVNREVPVTSLWMPTLPSA
ncbi:hypothetical protein FBZ93_10178 [Bradyrhizobium macuxiense]|uniref:SMODS and SLOG-associating 2TM effector domain-containing protein n=1 Tax=Bradyrhizobium macuxiense TaxID=1755647 RepID=A0A560MHG7_9BRAD|nr:hypothetical protein [Bradyrhizobium macuxiense]TWC06790.1 hypothetical protein FBZ93_10178 [Bradyrhizobium macuxiense]